jgi:hypothetical protein
VYDVGKSGKIQLKTSEEHYIVRINRRVLRLQFRSKTSAYKYRPIVEKIENTGRNNFQRSEYVAKYRELIKAGNILFLWV